MEPGFQVGFQYSILYVINTGLLIPYACQKEYTISTWMCPIMTKKKKRERLDNIWNYFRMEKSIIWNLKKKYFDVKMTLINDGKQGKWGKRQG